MSDLQTTTDAQVVTFNAIPRDRLGEAAVRLREVQLRYQRAYEEHHSAMARADSALSDLCDAADQLSRGAAYIIDEIVLSREVVS